MKKRSGIFRKAVSLLLTILCVVGLLPTAASAAGDSIKLKKFGMSGVAYESAALGECELHQMYVRFVP